MAGTEYPPQNARFAAIGALRINLVVWQFFFGARLSPLFVPNRTLARRRVAAAFLKRAIAQDRFLDMPARGAARAGRIARLDRGIDGHMVAVDGVGIALVTDRIVALQVQPP